MIKKLLIISTCLFSAIVQNAVAQDIHHTQYFSTPLMLNPAFTGLTRGDLRANINYRSQWAQVSNHPYITGSASFDMATLKGKLPEGHALGVGLLFAYDKSGIGALTNMQFGMSVAYHYAFGSEKQHTLSVGIQGMYVQKSIDFNALTFGNQFDAGTGSTPYSSGEDIGNKDLGYPDFNAGAMYTGRLGEHATMYVGQSFYHLTTPTETFLNGTNKIHMRYSSYIGGSFDLNDNMTLFTSAMYQNQGSASELMLGAAAGFTLNPAHDPEYHENTSLLLGAWYRYGDGICPYISLQWTKMALGISYDVNTSSFTPATHAQGAYEISVILNGKINKGTVSKKYNFSCPRF